MQCDMCGANKPLVRAKIEGTQLDVCENCAKYGEIVKTPKKIYTSRKNAHLKKEVKEEKVQLIVPNYYEIIHLARERKQLTQEEVAMKLAEKQSTYTKVEGGQLKPSIPLAKKIENFFKIKLIDEHTEKSFSIDNLPKQKNTTLTIGDMIKIKK